MKKVDVKESAVGRETRIRKQWNEQGIFEQSIQNTEKAHNLLCFMKDHQQRTAYHTSATHLGRAIKDLVARYKTMAGYKVLRKAGWDTHGLPVELGVEKQLRYFRKQ